MKLTREMLRNAIETLRRVSAPRPPPKLKIIYPRLPTDDEQAIAAEYGARIVFSPYCPPERCYWQMDDEEE